jgi:ankyrin repeat protein
MVHTISAGIHSAKEEDAELLLDGARYGDLEDVLSALERRVSADATDESGRTGTALQHAAGFVSNQAVGQHCLRRVFDDRNDSRAANARVALHMASANGHAEVVSALIAAGAVSTSSE